MVGHSHDGIDWDARLRRLRERDELLAPETAAVVRALLRQGDRSVIDIGGGAGGAAAAFATALGGGGGLVTLVDSAPELLSAAAEHARAHAPDGVEIRAVQADATSPELRSETGTADVIFASFVVHHLPDQLDGLHRLSGLVRPGGRLAVVESGLSPRVLPWDVGVGEPGLENRLQAARDDWFREVRAGMPGSRRLPLGWSAALRQVGLVDVTSWSYLIDRPAPLEPAALVAALRRLEWLRDAAQERGNADDVQAVEALLDSDGPLYVGHRDDVHYLVADTVHVGTRAH